jgi:hypothetical protein
MAVNGGRREKIEPQLKMEEQSGKRRRLPRRIYEGI